MAATIRHVAERAGVSIASVSRVLNGTGSVAPGTRERVLRAVKVLKYVPHESARSLITPCTRTIGVLLPAMHGEFFSELIRGCDKEARARGLYLLVTSSHGNETEVGHALRAMNGRVDGALVMSPFAHTSLIDESLATNLPVVLLNAPASVKARQVVAVDNFGGARAMVRHLLSQGCRRIVHIGGPARNHDARERLRGFLTALREVHADVVFSIDGSGHGEEGSSSRVRPGDSVPAGRVLPGDFTEEAGHRAGWELAGGALRPDAVFAANDMMAVGCLLALQEAGVRVPDEVAVAGFDDVPFTRYTSPPLTTMRARLDELVRAAFEMLDAGLVSTLPGAARGRPVPQGAVAGRVIVPTELVVRRSSQWRGGTGEGG